MDTKPLNKRIIWTNPDGTFDFSIVAAENGEILAFSRQGYEHVHDCIDTATRVTTARTDPVLTFADRDQK